MSTVIQIKRSEVTGSEPNSEDLQVGELAVNLTDKKLFSKDSNGTVVSIGGGIEVNNGENSSSVATITFADTAFSDFYVDTATSPGTAIVRLNQLSDLDYGLITDEVAPFNSVDYGSL